jgi:hypothetical protein
MTDYKSLFKNYIVLIALIIFVIVYIIINLDAIKLGDIYNGDLTKSLLITGIIVLLSYLFVTWDDDKETTEYNDIITNNNYYDNDIDKKNFNMNGGLYSHEPYGIKKFNLSSVPQNQPNATTATILTNLPVVNKSSNPISIASNPLQNQLPNQMVPASSQPIITVGGGGNAGNVGNQINDLQDKTIGESKYYILNQNINPIKQPNPLINLANAKNSLNKYDNPNIFISQKNMGKFGIKF